MRFRRNAVVHVLVIVTISVVALVGLNTHHYGIRSRETTMAILAGGASPVDVSTQNQLLMTAQVQRRQGRYEDAITSLEAVIASADAQTVGSALLESAKDYAAIGDTRTAVSALSTLRNKFPQSTAADEAQFQLGQSEATLGEYRSAISDLTEYAKRHPSVSPYIDVIMAGYQEKRGDLGTALSLAETAASSRIAVRGQVAALETIRDIEQKQQDFTSYLKTTNRLLELATIPSYRAELTYERASAEQKLGQNAKSIADLRTVVNTYPDSSYAIKALNDLNKLDPSNPVSADQSALIDYDRASYQSAMREFDSVLSTNPQDDEAWYYRAMSKLYSGDTWSAAVELLTMGDSFPTSRYTLGALYTAGKLFEENNDLYSAGQAYRMIIQLAPQSAEATNGRLRLGIVLYEQHDFSAAITTLAPIHGPSTSLAQASFWTGKAYQRLGDQTEAVQSWADASQANPTGYYGLRAQQMLDGSRPVADPQSQPTMSATLSPTDLTALANWYALQGTTESDALSKIAADPDFQRMSLLYELGLTDQAGWELTDLANKYGHDLASLAALGGWLDNAGQYNAAYRVGVRLLSLADAGGTNVPIALQRLAYPLAFPQLVEGQARANGINAYLLLAVIRQESGYDPTATSSAGARGLTQVMPSTGADIASSLGIKDWTADDLNRPRYAVQLGAIFLSDRLKKYQEEIFPALAAYNAGDGNVASWMTGDGTSDPDLFVEQIPFPETHDYVQLVYANYLNYLRLYGDQTQP